MSNPSRDVLKLLTLGIIFHIVFIASVFDCYFRSPVVHGMTRYGSTPGESKRLVLIVTAFELTSCSRQTGFRRSILLRRWLPRTLGPSRRNVVPSEYLTPGYLPRVVRDMSPS
ncbi:hypothetical protein J3R82DRAFT_9080 [Butyriboletus roseoflavus]|nr:hypothetical protein J3R82DRAFT_9080 [Butyriboletus roseoflavus]